MKRSTVEKLLGCVVIANAVGFLIFALQATEIRSADSYNLTARFLKVGGLEVGSDVRISGVKVGTITRRELDPKRFEAVVLFTIRSGLQLPIDTQAVVTSEGMLGNKYLRLIPGKATDKIAAGGEIAHIQDYLSLEDTVSSVIFSAKERQ